MAPGTSYDTGAGACIAIHAEQNVLLDTTPADRVGGTIYITREPCDGCLRMLQGSGVVRIVWPGGSYVLFNRNQATYHGLMDPGWHRFDLLA